MKKRIVKKIVIAILIICIFSILIFLMTQKNDNKGTPISYNNEKQKEEKAIVKYGVS